MTSLFWDNSTRGCVVIYAQRLSCLSATLGAALAPSAATQAQDQTAEPSSSKDKESSVENKRVREVNYVGINSISASEVLNRFKEDKVSLSLE